MIDSLEALIPICVYAVALFGGAAIASSLVAYLRRWLVARRQDVDSLGDAVTLTHVCSGQTVVVLRRLPQGFPGCELCALIHGVPIPPDPPGVDTPSLQCPKHYATSARIILANWGGWRG